MSHDQNTAALFDTDAVVMMAPIRVIVSIITANDAAHQFAKAGLKIVLSIAMQQTTESHNFIFGGSKIGNESKNTKMPLTSRGNVINLTVNLRRKASVEAVLQ